MLCLYVCVCGCVQVLNRTSRIEMQLLESSLSTRKLEKDLMVQTSELSRLLNRNRYTTLNLKERNRL